MSEKSESEKPNTETKTHLLTMNIPHKIFRKFKAICALQSLTMSEVILNLIEMYINKANNEK